MIPTPGVEGLTKDRHQSDDQTTVDPVQQGTAGVFLHKTLFCKDFFSDEGPSLSESVSCAHLISTLLFDARDHLN